MFPNFFSDVIGVTLERHNYQFLVSPPSEREAFTGSGHSTTTGRAAFVSV